MKPNGFANYAASAALASVMFLAGHAVAAPVTYSFSTNASPLDGVASLFLSGGASGTFIYDSSAIAVGVAPAGYVNYRGFVTEADSGLVSSLSALTGTVGAGFTFTDLSGSTSVGDESIGGTADFLHLVFEPSAGVNLPRNLTGFDIGGAKLENVRMIWVEGQFNPEPIPDFLSNQALPDALPSFHGRMMFDFVVPESGFRFTSTFDGLTVSAVTAVPEPQTYAMLLAGLALLGFAARRRRIES